MWRSLRPRTTIVSLAASYELLNWQKALRKMKKAMPTNESPAFETGGPPNPVERVQSMLSCSLQCDDTARSLNQQCFCVTLDRDVLRRELFKDSALSGMGHDLLEERPHLFSNVPVFVDRPVVSEMMQIVEAIERVSKLPQYLTTALAWAGDIAKLDLGPVGAFMGYDFHLGEVGPQLIEVNTNAGGAFLNAVLARAQRKCCAGAFDDRSASVRDDFNEQVCAMFQEEWLRQRGRGLPRSIAIVDDAPQEQYLYPEFLLAKKLLIDKGVNVLIGDARNFTYRAGKLFLSDQEIDLVYNRLVDFSLSLPEHAALCSAYQAGTVVVTPNPRNHAVLANKRNLTVLSNADLLRAWGVDEATVQQLAKIPHTVMVADENAEELWRNRKEYFFKPLSGHGSKAVYRGDKLTKRVWADILAGNYVAQSYAPPAERTIALDGEATVRKMDIRLYTYNAKLLLAAARIYQGQTTNFRTEGGGFAPILIF